MRRCAIVMVGCLGVVAAIGPRTVRAAGGEGVSAADGGGGLRAGLIVHVGCGDGRRTAELAAGGRALVQGLDTDADQVRRAREFLCGKGLYGRVTVARWSGRELPYIDNLVNLLVVDGKAPDLTRAEILRVLAPGGEARIGGKTLTKPWPAEMDEWTHWLHGPGNNAVSADTAVGISRRLQWIDGPLWGRHHNLLPSVSAMVSAGGRVYCIIDEAPIAVCGKTDEWRLVARDAFNGAVLWKRAMKDWGWREWSAVEFSGLMRFKGPGQLFRRLVAAGDVVYVTLGFRQPIVALDGKTGKTLRTYKGTENAAEILFSEDKLFLSRNVFGKRPGKDILAVDAETGKVLWERKGFVGITSRGDELKAFTDTYLTLGGGRVYFLDRDDVVALDQTNGKELWRAPRPAMPKDVFGHYQMNFVNLCTLVYEDGRVFLGQIHPKPTNLNAWQIKDMALLALDAKTGKELWRHEAATLAHFTPPDVFVRGGLVWTMGRGQGKRELLLVGRDAATGSTQKSYPITDLQVGHHHRCYRDKATQRFYLAGEEGIEYIDFATGALDVHHWMRGACAYGILPANGLIYLPSHACGCHANAKLHGFLALASGGSNLPKPLPPKSRLEKGPAYAASQAADLRSEISDQKATAAASQAAGVRSAGNPEGTVGAQSEDWPVFRGDNARSGFARTDAPTKLAVRWKTDLGGNLTAPVIAGGRVVCAVGDRGEVVCLDAESGKVQWRFVADGPVDSPPALRAGRVVFGSGGGSVYALRAEDGAMIWRFQAAPVQRYLTAFGRVASLWPVHGSVLVDGGTVYCVAGRSMNLDGGLYLYALDLADGTVLSHARWQADTAPKGELKGVVLPDILVGQGGDISMRDVSIDPKTLAARPALKAGRVLRANDGGLLDSTWLNNTFWKLGRARGQVLVFSPDAAYGVSGVKKLVTKSYPQDIFTPGKGGYELFAVDLSGKAAKVVDRKGKKPRKGKARARVMWSQHIGIRAQALALTRDHLCLAGAPDTIDPGDPWGAFEDRKGGLLAVHTRTDGKQVARLALPSAPVPDALAVAGGRLFVCLHNGQVLCVAAPEEGR